MGEKEVSFLLFVLLSSWPIYYKPTSLVYLFWVNGRLTDHGNPSIILVGKELSKVAVESWGRAWLASTPSELLQPLLLLCYLLLIGYSSSFDLSVCKQASWLTAHYDHDDDQDLQRRNAAILAKAEDLNLHKQTCARVNIQQEPPSSSFHCQPALL